MNSGIFGVQFGKAMGPKGGFISNAQEMLFALSKAFRHNMPLVFYLDYNMQN